MIKDLANKLEFDNFDCFWGKTENNISLPVSMDINIKNQPTKQKTTTKI